MLKARVKTQVQWQKQPSSGLLTFRDRPPVKPHRIPYGIQKGQWGSGNATWPWPCTQHVHSWQQGRV